MTSRSYSCEFVTVHVGIVVSALQNIGAIPEHIIAFLKGIYEPLGITVADDVETESSPRKYTAKQIVEKLGIYSIAGNPRPQVVACILNENLFVSDEIIG